ncbi:MAG TPA: hypothetical protein DD618_02060 [Acholeplasmatales bacterium]|nr:hypothetical protein [Acholeplasmatales bacterium]
MKKAQNLLVWSLLVFFLFACSLTRKFHVVFEANGGIWAGGGELIQKVPSGEGAVVPLVEREGYDFVGWSAAFSEVTSDLTVTAFWEIKTFTVQFETDGGVYDGQGGPLTQTINYQESANPPVLTKTNFVFAGWSVDYASVSEDLVVFPLWRHFNGDEIGQMMGSAVVEIFAYGKFEEQIRVGSGFFRSSDGEIVTNFHLIAGAYYLKVKVSTGKILEVSGILGYSIALDLAILKVDYEPVKCLTASGRQLEAGGNIFAVGSSHGLYTVFTSGFMTDTSQYVRGVECIKTNALVYFGNDGGPLFNEYAEVIGINSATLNSENGIYYAIKMNQLDKVDCSIAKTVIEVYNENQYYTILPFEYNAPEWEPNDIKTQANFVANGTTISGEMPDAGDDDYFRMYIKRSGLLVILLVPTYFVDVNFFTVVIRNNLNGALAIGEVVYLDDYSEVVKAECRFREEQLIFISVGLKTSYPWVESAPYHVFFYVKYD